MISFAQALEFFRYDIRLTSYRRKMRKTPDSGSLLARSLWVQIFSPLSIINHNLVCSRERLRGAKCRDYSSEGVSCWLLSYSRLTEPRCSFQLPWHFVSPAEANIPSVAARVDQFHLLASRKMSGCQRSCWWNTKNRSFSYLPTVSTVPAHSMSHFSYRSFDLTGADVCFSATWCALD